MREQIKLLNKKMDLSGVNKKIDTNVDQARELYKKDAEDKKARELSDKRARDTSLQTAKELEAKKVADALKAEEIKKEEKRKATEKEAKEKEDKLKKDKILKQQEEKKKESQLENQKKLEAEMKQKLTSQNKVPVRQPTEEDIPEDYSDDDFDAGIIQGKPSGTKEKPSPSVNTSTKQYLAQQIADRDLKASLGSEYSNNSLFQHSLKDRVDGMRAAQGELQVSSNALLKEQMDYLKIRPGARSKTATGLVDDQIFVDK